MRLARFAHAIPDVIAIVCFALLGAFGKLSPEASAGFILAVCSGRLYPKRRGSGNGEDVPISEKTPPKDDEKKDSKGDQRSADTEDDEPSGVMTIVLSVVALLASILPDRRL